MQDLINHLPICTFLYSGNTTEAINLFKENFTKLKLSINFAECKLFVTTLNFSIYNYILLKENVSLHQCCLDNNTQINHSLDLDSLEKIGILTINNYYQCRDYLFEKITHPDIKKAVQYIHAHLSQPLTLEDICLAINLNKCYFCTLFKIHTGSTFTQYLNLSRVKMAKHLISQTNLSLHDIAYRCGFNNYSYFCTTFKKITGTNPSEI